MNNFTTDKKSFEKCPNCGRLREKDTGECIFCGNVFEEEMDEFEKTNKAGIKVPVPDIGGGNPLAEVIFIPIFLALFGAFLITIGIFLPSIWMLCFGGMIIIGIPIFLLLLAFDLLF